MIFEIYFYIYNLIFSMFFKTSKPKELPKIEEVIIPEEITKVVIPENSKVLTDIILDPEWILNLFN
jgi:hypothetical protein